MSSIWEQVVRVHRNIRRVNCLKQKNSIPTFGTAEYVISSTGDERAMLRFRR